MPLNEQIKVTGRILPISESTKRLNPSMFAGQLGNPIGKPDALQTLESRPRVRRASKGRVAVVVSIISKRARAIDGDNLIAGCKPLRDAIALTLGIDDGDPRVRWEYSQIETKGKPGTVVIIGNL